MVRTQIYLTEQEQNCIRGLSLETGKAQSEIIREAIDSFIGKNKPLSRIAALKKARGIWKDRKDIFDVRDIRKEFDRAL